MLPMYHCAKPYVDLPNLMLILREVLLLFLFSRYGNWNEEAQGLTSSDGRAGIQSSVIPEVAPEPMCDIAFSQCLGTKYLSYIKKSICFQNVACKVCFL